MHRAVFSIRGGDVPFTPFALSFAIVHADGATELFIDAAKLPAESRAWLGNAVSVSDRGALGPALDTATGTQEFRAVFANGDRILVPGQTVRVRLVGFARERALAVPSRAVLTGLGRQFVYVVGPGDTARARDIVPGPWSGERWIVDHGLEPGDRVIVDGVQKIGPGAKVIPMPLGDSAASTCNRVIRSAPWQI